MSTIKSDNSNLILNADGAGSEVKFHNNGVEKVTINSSGDVGIGTSPRGKFDVVTGAGGFRINRNPNMVPTGNTPIFFVSSDSGQAPVSQFKLDHGGALDMMQFINSYGMGGSIRLSGNVTAYNTGSDYRLKENVVPMTGSIDRLKVLKPSRFNFIVDADITIDGFLAHEAQEVVPEAITGTKDAMNDDGTPKMQSIDQSKLVPLLVSALQEAVTKIEELTTRIETLEGGV